MRRNNLLTTDCILGRNRIRETVFTAPVCDGEEVDAAQVRRDLGLKHFNDDWLCSQGVRDRKRLLRVRDKLTRQLDRPGHRQAVLWQGNSAAKPGYDDKEKRAGSLTAGR